MIKLRGHRKDERRCYLNYFYVVVLEGLVMYVPSWSGLSYGKQQEKVICLGSHRKEATVL